MSKVFIDLYLWFRRHRTAFWVSMFGSVVALAVMAMRISFEENITSFFPHSGNTANMSDVFANLKVSDKVVVMFSMSDCRDLPMEMEDSMAMASAYFGKILSSVDRDSLVLNYMSEVTGSDASQMISFVLKHLPLFVEESDYERIEASITPSAVDSSVRKSLLNLISPAGFAMKDYIMKDPLGLSSGVMRHLPELNPATDYQVRASHVYTPDGNTMLGFVEPSFPSGETAHNDRLISMIDIAADSVMAEFPAISVHYFGGPAMSVYNARQIKRDTYSTSIVALFVIVLFILSVFKRRKSVFLILCPVLYGIIFAIAMSWLIQGSISGIAIGACAAIMGIALSYSIHILAHQNYVSSVEDLLREISSPLIIGSITTIGAFVGLLFTSSGLLQDFGLFAALTLFGTMFFCLVFLPQFLSGQADIREGKVLHFIGKISSYHFEKNRPVVWSIVIVTAVCAWMSTKVGFDSDMMDLTYWEPDLAEAEKLLTAHSDTLSKTVMFVSVAPAAEEAFKARKTLLEELDSLKSDGMITDFCSGGVFVSGQEEQRSRIEQWNRFWTPEKIASLTSSLHVSAAKYGFREDAFDETVNRLSEKYNVLNYFDCEDIPAAFASWAVASDRLKMFITQVRLPTENIDEVYARFSSRQDLVIFDQGYFACKAAEGINRDFYLILFISSFLIFFVLWLSYGRIELALLSFLPMTASWVIITGIMGFLGVRFNIVNIILSTFIFGMGDDFSIFIMESLLYRYKTGKKLLDPNKTAIFFSAFTMVTGIGALIFAKHPALHSIALITILGMIAVVLVAYTAEPVIFNAFVMTPTSRGRPPYTVFSVIRDVFFYVPAVLGSAVIVFISLILMIIPFRKSSRQAAITWMLHRACRWLIGYARFIRCSRYSPDGSRLRSWTGEPGIVVANHQSSLDIIMIAATFPKLKFMVADWVLKSPLFGMITRFMGYYSKSEGYEAAMNKIGKDVRAGWSLAVFPEGTRSLDGRIRRFHKGAFYLASKLDIPLIPVVFYGNWRIAPKNQGFNMTCGIAVMEIRQPIMPGSEDYHDLTVRVNELVRSRYAALCMKYDGPVNPYFRRALESAYIYKGPVTEWYVKVKTAMENSYARFHDLVPRSGRITDLGCGMGQMDIMLSMYCPEREILGIDYDGEKIAIARNCWIVRNLPRLNFECADATTYDLPVSNTFIISDMLHYLEEQEQEALVMRCASRLEQGGQIIIRDSNAEKTKGQKVTALSELFSTRIVRFNKTSGQLHFLTVSKVREIAERAGLSFECHPNDRMTSNTVYILKPLKP